MKSKQFGVRLSLEAQRLQDGPKFKVGHAAVEHGTEQFAGRPVTEVARAPRPPPDVLEVA